METITQMFIVSDSPDHIEPSHEGTPTRYATPEEAGEAIKNGNHGDYGSRYVLKVALTTVAEYHRPWTMIRKDA